MDNLKHGKNELGEYFLLPLNKTLYSREAIMKTCYAFTDDFFIHAVKSENEDVGIYIYQKSDSVNDINTVAKHFLHLLHENQMREIIHDETSVLHEEIVRKAFSPAAVFVENRVQADAQDILKSVV
ncbi:His-Xaa-Ser system protein HxsD [Enterobacter asburiae]|uniref:His-Xaa-Ser system protein HxsD n=1 Tax=Enterobacter asburiae TaxID=61645 RepID=UPI00163CA82B|nr:His-Xaa-Ser system protein HxsD [Enterobacter asburiae]MBN4798776.1 His-Xaa-Ser system protein HxsD [Enterobacter asburiae]MBN4802807.1 His-Xaa-Ser system protein HxsD [Enterobacter asburiae]HDR2720560.1 His-Xaa-Ser system protein HxsD [Enterobacter asburiae]HDR2724075.1 His-Xaa-Ser system protein HxsD [Enterobacter asburiae]